jgi:hypothetical protein
MKAQTGSPCAKLGMWGSLAGIPKLGRPLLLDASLSPRLHLFFFQLISPPWKA